MSVNYHISTLSHSLDECTAQKDTKTFRHKLHSNRTESYTLPRTIDDANHRKLDRRSNSMGQRCTITLLIFSMPQSVVVLPLLRLLFFDFYSTALHACSTSHFTWNRFLKSADLGNEIFRTPVWMSYLVRQRCSLSASSTSIALRTPPIPLMII